MLLLLHHILINLICIDLGSENHVPFYYVKHIYRPVCSIGKIDRIFSIYLDYMLGRPFSSFGMMLYLDGSFDHLSVDCPRTGTTLVHLVTELVLLYMYIILTCMTSCFASSLSVTL